MRSVDRVMRLSGCSGRPRKIRRTAFAFGLTAVRLGVVCAMSFFAVDCLRAPAALHAADQPPGSQRDARFQVGDKTVVLRFRVCPSGKLIPGDPRKSPEPVEMGSFYFGETEITFAQIRDLLGEAKHKELLDGVRQIDSANAMSHLLDMQEIPAFGIVVEDLILLCRELNRLSDANSGGDLADIETRRFRPPTHYEWQYAARSEATADITYPHFHGWPAGSNPHQDMPSQIQGKSLERWKALGKNEAEFRGLQEQVVQLCSRVGDDGENRDGLDVLTAYLRRGLEMSEEWDLSLVDPRDPLLLLPAGSGRANNWQIHGLHSGATEWCLHGFQSGSQAATEFWNEVLKNDEVGAGQKRRRVWLVVGGGFHKTIWPTTDPLWSTMAIWGGQNQEDGVQGGPLNFDPSTGKVSPFSMDEMEEDIAGHIVEDEFPGVRLVLERALNGNWLTIVRKGVIGEMPDYESLHSRFDLRKKRITELVPAKQLPETVAKLEHYRALAVYRSGKVAEAKERVRKLDYGSPNEGDGLYFSLVRMVMENDAAPDEVAASR